MARYVPFQRWRIFWWAMKMAAASGANKESNPAASQAYRELSELGKDALVACRTGQQDVMIARLDALAGRTLVEYANDELERMLAGTHEDVPEWLKKDQ